MVSPLAAGINVGDAPYWDGTQWDSKPVNRKAKLLVTDSTIGTGDYVCDGSADEVEINNALSALTYGRTHIETVELKGNFSIHSHITQPSYSLIDATQAYITPDTNTTMLYSESTTLAKVRGGIWDANSLLSANHHGIHYNGVTDGLIEEPYVKNVSVAQCYPVYVYNSTRVNTLKAKASGCDDGFTISQSTNSNFDLCWHAGIGATSACFVIIGASAGTPSVGCNIINCDGDSSGNHGAQLYRYLKDCYVIGGHYYNFTTTGVCLGQISYINTCTNVGAIGVTCDTGTSSSASGIYAWNPAVIEGNSILAAGSAGIIVGTGVSNVTASANVINAGTSTTSYGLYAKGSYSNFNNNIVIGNPSAYMWGARTLGTYNTFTANQISGWYYGYQFDAGANYNKWAWDNTLASIGSGGNVDSGTGNMFETL